MIVNGKPLPRVTIKRGKGLAWSLDIDGVPIPYVLSLDYTDEPGGFPVVTFHMIAELYNENEPAESATDIAPWQDGARFEAAQ